MRVVHQYVLIARTGCSIDRDGVGQVGSGYGGGGGICRLAGRLKRDSACVGISGPKPAQPSNRNKKEAQIMAFSA